eukprot:sb/3469061/
MARDSKGRPSNLVIFDLTVSDSGEYYCGVSNSITQTFYGTDSAYVRIEVGATTTGTWDPVRVVPNYDYQGTEGTTITLYAGVASRPKADYIWSIDGVTITTGDRFSFDDYDRSLIISDLQPADQGTYVVTYEQDGVSEGTINVVLDVIEKVEAEGDVYDYATVEDSKTEVYVTVNNKNTGKALVKSVSDGDSGTYACTCFNQAEFLSFTKNVFVADEMVALSIASQREGWGLVGSTVSIS